MGLISSRDGIDLFRDEIDLLPRWDLSLPATGSIPFRDGIDLFPRRDLSLPATGSISSCDGIYLFRDEIDPLPR